MSFDYLKVHNSAATDDRGVLKQFPTGASAGDAYGFVWDADNSTWVFGEVEAIVPLDTFVEGWAEFPFRFIEDIVSSGTIHAAVSIGNLIPTIAGVTFERSQTGAGDANVANDATGITGTNWQIRRGNQAVAPLVSPTIGNNAARSETAAYADLPDPSFGSITGAEEICDGSMRRNTYHTFSNLTPGNRYYASFLFATYPNSLTRATQLLTDVNGVLGDTIEFGVDGADSILSKSIKRFGFTATGTEMSVLKQCYDNNGSYHNAAWVTDEGTP